MSVINGKLLLRMIPLPTFIFRKNTPLAHTNTRDRTNRES